MKSKKLSVNIIGKVPPPIGGVTIHTLRLYRWLKKEKNTDVTLTALNKHIIKDQNIQYTGNILFWILKKLLFGFKEDIVHYQGANHYGLAILFLIKKMHPNFKLLWSIHSEYLINSIQKKILFRFIINQVDHIIADNINIKKQIINVNYKKNIHIVSPFLMPDNYEKNDNRFLDQYRINNEKLLIFNAYKLVFNSNNEDVYGLDTLLKAFSQVNKYTKLILLIPSMNTEEKIYYNSLLKKINSESRKNIVLISDLDVDGWQYINSADIFIRPTITDGDALSVKEAIYMNKITIASDCTVRPSGVILFKTSCAKDLAEKINHALALNNTINSEKENNIVEFIALYKMIKEENENTFS